MDYPIELDALEGQLTFSSLSHLIRKEIIPVNDNAKARIIRAKDFFERVIDGLENIIDDKKAYILVKHLERILKSAGYSTSNHEITEAIKEFKNYAERLNVLEENPKRFYSEENYKRERLLKVCESMRNLYDRISEEERLQKEKEEEADY